MCSVCMLCSVAALNLQECEVGFGIQNSPWFSLIFKVRGIWMYLDGFGRMSLDEFGWVWLYLAAVKNRLQY